MSAFRLGEYVEVWSVSQKSWDVATVTEVHADGTILTQYQRSDSGVKTFPLSAQVPGTIRKAAVVSKCAITRTPISVVDTPHLVYTTGVTQPRIVIADHITRFQTLRPIYAQYQPAIHEWLHSGNCYVDITAVYHQCDHNSDAKLEWNNGEVREFLSKMLAYKGWPAPPSDFDLYNLYRQFDADNNGSLDLHEAANFAHAYLALVYRVIC